MSWAVRRESILANELSLRSQADGSFGWLEASTVNIFGDEKVSSNPVEQTLSPASTISSGPSSANTSPCPVRTKGTFDDDSESDAGFDTDHSQYEPYYIDNDKYSVIDGKAYMIPTYVASHPASTHLTYVSSSISQPVFGQTSYPGLSQLPIHNNALSPMAEVRHLPQLPSARTSSPLLPPFQRIDSRSPSPFLPLPAPLPPRALSRGKRSRNTKTKRAKRPRTSLILAEDSDRDAEGEEEDNASDDDDEWVPYNQPKQSKKRSRADHSSQFDTWNFAAAQGSSNATSRSLAQIAPHDVRPAKRTRTSPQSRNVQVPALSQPEDAIDDLSFKCSECGWVQLNKRLPDFKRHLRTHTRPDDRDQSRGWWCKGVLASSVPGFHGEAYEFNGELRFGGCLRTFSRRDALKRHLDNRNVCCLGSIHQDN